MKPSATPKQCALMFLFLYLPYVYFNHSDGWNQHARFAELHAVVLQHTLAIDSYHEITGDKALLNGHYYSEKAPAISLLAMPAFALTTSRATPDGNRSGFRAGVALVRVDDDRRIGRRARGAGRRRLLCLAAAAVRPGRSPRCHDRRLPRIAHIPVRRIAVRARRHDRSALHHAVVCAAGSIELSRARLSRRHLRRLGSGIRISAIIPLGCLFLYLSSDAGRSVRFAVGVIPGLLLILLKNLAITGLPSLVSGFNPGFAKVTAQNAFGFDLPAAETVKALLWGTRTAACCSGVPSC